MKIRQSNQDFNNIVYCCFYIIYISTKVKFKYILTYKDLIFIPLLFTRCKHTDFIQLYQILIYIVIFFLNGTDLTYRICIDNLSNVAST